MDHGITTRRAGAAEATRCSRARRSSAVQLRGRPSARPSRAVHPCALDAAPPRYPHKEEASRLRTARSARNEGMGVGRAAAAKWCGLT